MKLASLARPLRRGLRRTGGAAMIDYIVVLGVIALLAAATMFFFGKDVRDLFLGAGNGLGTITNPAGGNPGNGGTGGPIDPNNQPPTIITTNLPLATVGRSYNFQIDATDNEGDPLSFALAGGTLPPGLHVSAIGNIFGVPTTAGSWSFSVSVTDTNRGSTQQNLTIEVNTPPVWSLPQGDALRGEFGIPYSTQLVATDPDGDSVSFSLFSGSLPAGLVLGPDGRLSGTPAAAGFSTFTVAATDSRGASTLQSFSLDTSSAPVWVTPAGALANGMVGEPYFKQLEATDADNDPLTYELGSGSLPPGLLLTTNGRIMGTPTAGAQRSFSVRVFDGRGNEAFQSFTLRTTNKPAWSTAPGLLAPIAEIGKPYSTQVVANDPDGDALTYSAYQSPLPRGLTLNAQNGTISGTPLDPGLQGFTLDASDAFGGSAQRSFAIRVSTAPAWVTPEGALPTAVIAQAYETLVKASDPDGDPVTVTLLSGALPTGLLIDSTGRITGNPSQGGTFNFTARASDSTGLFVDRSFSIEITRPPVWVTQTTDPTLATAGTSYSYQLQATDPDGDALSYSLSNRDDRLPDGLSLGTNGLITGKPIVGGVTTFNVTVADNKGGMVQRLFQIEVNSAPVFGTPPSLAEHLAGQPYSQTIAISDPQGDAFTVALTDGSLPDGLRFDPVTHTVSGTPTTNAATTFELTATDARGAVSSRVFGMNQNMPPAWATPAGALPTAQIGSGYNVQLSAIDNSPVAYALSGGALPAGLSLSGNVISGTPTIAGDSTFTVTASDGVNPPVARSFSILVNQSPVWQTTNADFPVLKAGVPYNVPLVATDPDGDAVQFTLFTQNTPGVLPQGLRISSGAVTGTPTADTSSSFVIAASDTNGGSTNRAFSILAQNNPAAPGNKAPQWTMSSETLPPVEKGTPYPLQLTAVDPDGDPLTFMIVQGQLPTALQLDQQTGLISGIPQISGMFPLTFRVKDDHDNVSSDLQLTLVINGAPIWTTPAGALANGSIGQPYGPVPLQATDPDGDTLHYGLPNMQVLPPGFTLNTGTGVISGTPSAGGDFTFDIRVFDPMGLYSDRTFTIFVNADPVWLTGENSLPPASLGVPYSFQLRASDANASQTLTYSITGGALPGGLSMSNSGTITGVPTTTSGSFTVRVFDGAGGVAFRTFTIVPNAAPAWQQPAGALGVATVGESFSSQLAASDANNDPLTFTLDGGQLPPGLSLGSDGEISGTPSAAPSADYIFTVRVADPAGLSATRNFSILTNNKPVWNTPAGALPGENVTVPYSFTFDASDPDGHAISYSLASGTLPPGLALSAQGVLSGTPQQAGDFAFSVAMQDSYATGSTRSFTINIRTGTMWVTPSGVLDPATVGHAYSFQLQATSPFNGVTYSVSNGATPPGVSLGTNGMLSGTPTTGGVSNFEVTASDAQNITAKRQFSIATNTPPEWQTPGGDLGAILAANAPMSPIQLSATDADGQSIAYTLAAGSSLPSGLMLDPSGVISGTPTTPGSTTVSINATDGMIAVPRSFTLRVNSPPAWQTPAGQLGAYRDGTALSFSISATDPEGQAVTYSLIGGNLPTGLTMNASGLVSGTIATVSQDTTSTFMVQATDTMGAASERQFSIFVRKAQSVIYSYTGADQSFVVPQGVTSIDVKLWGAGGGGGSTGSTAGSGGGGGFTSGTLAVTPGETLTMVVGGGGAPGNPSGNGNCLSTSPATLVGAYGGGGAKNAAYSSSGGGRSAVRRAADELATAGGGGGGGTRYTSAGDSSFNGGAGGGVVGDGPQAGLHGGGGGQSSSDNRAPINIARSLAGTQFKGGNGGCSGFGGGGGGGGGYYGGASGSSDYGVSANTGGGGGGSGYTGGLTASTSSAGSGAAAGNNSDGDYVAGIGQGGGPNAQGGNGRIVIVY